MRKQTNRLVLGLYLVALSFAGCSGMKVIHPNDRNPNAGTMALDVTDGQIKFVSTYTCTLLGVSGKRHSAVGKTEAATRDEVLAKCRNDALLSFCKPENAVCQKN
jgi:hypothetical protein